MRAEMKNARRISWLAIMVVICCSCRWHGSNGTNIYGVVYADGAPMKGVLVSDGHDFVITDKRGRYEMTSSKRSQSVFIVTPSGYCASCKEGDITPAFWHLVSPDSTIVERCDFKLEAKGDSKYGIIFITDCHLFNDSPVRNDLELFDSLTMTTYRAIYEKLVQGQNVYTVNLGDLSYDRYWYANDYDLDSAYTHIIDAGIRYPLYSVIGNHDHDPAISIDDVSMEDFEAQHMYRRLFGPDRYSVNIGGDHWIFMDNMQYLNTPDSSVKDKGVAGRRNFEVRYTGDQMDWLKKDLSYVSPGTHVYMCSHGPLIDIRGYRHLASQIREIDSLAGVGNLMIDFYAGHVHRMDNSSCPEYPHLRIHSLPASSGNIWECAEEESILGLDGCAGGLVYMECGQGRKKMHYVTYGDEFPYWRAYDMNELCHRWKTSPRCKWIADEVSGYLNYTSDDYRNGILVNYWWFSEGDRVEILEDGCNLQVGKAPFSVDPSAIENQYSFRRSSYEGRHFRPEDKELGLAKLFYAKASRPDSQILVRAIDTDGNVIAEQIVSR